MKADRMKTVSMLSLALVSIVPGALADTVEPPKMEAVASYSPRPEFAGSVERLGAVLQEHGIRAITTQSAGGIWHVSAADAARARQLIQQTVQSHRLAGVQVLPAQVPPLLDTPFLRERIPSPNGAHTIEYLGFHGGQNGQAFRVTLRAGDRTLWEYSSAGRGFEFSWAPGSDRFLLLQTEESRSMRAWIVRIGAAGEVSMKDLNLDLLEEYVEANVPERHSSSAPKTRLDEIAWVSPTRFTAMFVRRFPDRDGDVRFAWETEQPLAVPIILKVAKPD